MVRINHNNKKSNCHNSTKSRDSTSRSKSNIANNSSIQDTLLKQPINGDVNNQNDETNKILNVVRRALINAAEELVQHKSENLFNNNDNNFSLTIESKPDDGITINTSEERIYSNKYNNKSRNNNYLKNKYNNKNKQFLSLKNLTSRKNSSGKRKITTTNQQRRLQKHIIQLKKKNLTGRRK
ncbi:unnamed protein product [Didymodactylos carnosus]|uniref:Uncharacterized protein n=1 Tax=Didymodactylos carnosus TaxID=1234261 RepID=A0A813QG83_9BILA|nr:unnamed protein product [Didymodactylos carnosus]CAF1088915.1 unnamed protein product [Didymodactylos carnosus]CAF3549147.1 unnamed protein product [Didymodactylos carnosus]CAF3850680.1 unnamed protein product [Didymodactylos carnosus]